MPRDNLTREAAEEILGLPHRYTKGDVRRTYTKLARTYHPDAAARNNIDANEAQRRMVEANQAYEVLKRLFAHDPNRVVERDFGTSSSGADDSFADDWYASYAAATGYADEGQDTEAAYGDYEAYAAYANTDDPWGFADDWGAEPAPQEVPLSVRSVLLGPVVLRVVAIAVLAWLWWRNFPLLSHNAARFMPDGGPWTLKDVARLLSAMVYPSYFLVYEAASGYVSGLVREVLNGAVTWVCRRYVDLRPKSASYGCALSKLLREQSYALLLLPLVLYLVATALVEDSIIPKIMLGVLAAILGVDTLAAITHGGFVNVWSSALAEQVEARYLLIRAALLRRCGQWDGRAS